jgi:competence protein ComGC
MEVDYLKQRAREIHSEYAFSRVEMAKIMFIVSTTLIVVSIPAALSFQSAADQTQSVNNQLSQTSAILNSDRVQTSLDVLRNTQGSSFEQISSAIDAFERSEKAINNTQTLQTDMEKSTEMYQWIVLIGIIGEVTAAAIFFS